MVRGGGNKNNNVVDGKVEAKKEVKVIKVLNSSAGDRHVPVGSLLADTALDPGKETMDPLDLEGNGPLKVLIPPGHGSDREFPSDKAHNDHR